MSGEQLAGLDKMAAERTPAPNYAGRGGVRGNAQEGEEELAMPELFPAKKGA